MTTKKARAGQIGVVFGAWFWRWRLVRYVAGFKERGMCMIVCDTVPAPAERMDVFKIVMVRANGVVCTPFMRTPVIGGWFVAEELPKMWSCKEVFAENDESHRGKRIINGGAIHVYNYSGKEFIHEPRGIASRFELRGWAYPRDFIAWGEEWCGKPRESAWKRVFFDPADVAKAVDNWRGLRPDEQESVEEWILRDREHQASMIRLAISLGLEKDTKRSVLACESKNWR